MTRVSEWESVREWDLVPSFCLTFKHFLTWKHASNTIKLLDFLNFIQPELLVPFLASFWGTGRVRSDFVKKNIEFIVIRQKSRFSQFWTFMPIISNLLEHLKISIMPPKNDWKVLYNIKSIDHNIRGHMESSNWRYIGWWNPPPPPRAFEVLSNPGLARVNIFFCEYTYNIQYTRKVWVLSLVTKKTKLA